MSCTDTTDRDVPFAHLGYRPPTLDKAEQRMLEIWGTSPRSPADVDAVIRIAIAKVTAAIDLRKPRPVAPRIWLEMVLERVRCLIKRLDDGEHSPLSVIIELRHFVDNDFECTE